VISQTRYKIERTFGSIHKWLNQVKQDMWERKIYAQRLIQAICYTLKRIPVIDIV